MRSLKTLKQVSRGLKRRGEELTGKGWKRGGEGSLET